MLRGIRWHVLRMSIHSKNLVDAVVTDLPRQPDGGGYSGIPRCSIERDGGSGLRLLPKKRTREYQAWSDVSSKPCRTPLPIRSYGNSSTQRGRHARGHLCGERGNPANNHGRRHVESNPASDGQPRLPDSATATSPKCPMVMVSISGAHSQSLFALFSRAQESTPAIADTHFSAGNVERTMCQRAALPIRAIVRAWRLDSQDFVCLAELSDR